MRISTLLIPAVLFTGLFVGINTFGMDLYERTGVEAEGIESIEDQHHQLETDFSEQASDQSTWQESEGIRERVAGALFVPRIASDVLSVRNTYNDVLDSVQRFEWVPNWSATMIRSTVSIAFFLALLSLAVRHRA